MTVLPLRRSVAPSLYERFPAAVAANDPRVYDMICRADTIGVFHRLCVKLGMTPQMVMDVAVTNLKETFTTDPAAVRGPLGGITRSTRAE